MANNGDNQTNAPGPLDQELERVRQEDTGDQQVVENILSPSLDTMTSQQMEKGERKKKRKHQARRLTDDTFDTVLILDQHVTPFKLHLRLHTHRFLQLERHDRSKAVH